MAGRILCVLTGGLAGASLVRSCSLARSASAELVVACMDADGVRATTLSGALGDSELIEILATYAEDEVPVSSRLPADRVVAAAGRIASEHAVGLVVLPGSLASRAVALTEQLGVPVLVAHPTRGGSVLAAIAMSSRDDLVVAAGHQLAGRLGASLVVVHNRSPGDPDAESEAQLDERLAETSRHFGSVRTVVTREACATRGVLDTARVEAADVIVVGVPARSWLRRELDRGMPERCAREGGRSMLMVPVQRHEA